MSYEADKIKLHKSIAEAASGKHAVSVRKIAAQVNRAPATIKLHMKDMVKNGHVFQVVSVTKDGQKFFRYTGHRNNQDASA